MCSSFLNRYLLDFKVDILLRELEMYSNNVSEMTVFGSMTSAPMNGSNESSGGASGVHLVTGEEGMPPYPDDLLQPIERLEKYSVSEIIFHR